MSDRSLSSLGLPIATLSALERFGYDTVSDLSKSTPEDLSRGLFHRAIHSSLRPPPHHEFSSYSLCDFFAELRTIPVNGALDLNIPLPASQAIFHSASRPTQVPTVSMTQSAASMMGNSAKRYSTSCAPLDQLLDGGLKCGHVLEISGPPGCGKEQLAARAIKSFVQAQEEVLFVGTASSCSQSAPSFLRQSHFFFLCRLLKVPKTDMPTPCGLRRYAEHGSSRHHQENFVRCVLPRHQECRPALTKPFFSLL